MNRIHIPRQLVLAPLCTAALLAATALPVTVAAPARVIAAAPTTAHHATTPAAKRVAVAPTAPAAALGPLENIPQTWNNCGPASVAEVLAYWGIYRTQDETKAVLRGDGNPYGMSPYDVPAYMRSLGMRGIVGVGGAPQLVKALIANGFPVIVSQYVSVTDHIGHYRPIQAYDDRQGIFTSSDPYLGQGHTITYADFSTIWNYTNHRFIVLYPPAKQALVSAVLASMGWNTATAYAQDLVKLQKQHLHPSRAAAAYSGSPYARSRNYELSLAWDNIQLRRFTAARAAIALAARQGANPVVVGWVQNELNYVASQG
jgi:predicted double-glycine peptidase